MSLKKELLVFKEQWQAVERVQVEEHRLAPISLRWRQLNAAYDMGKGLRLLQPDASEMEVFLRWAKLKQKMTTKA